MEIPPPFSVKTLLKHPKTYKNRKKPSILSSPSIRKVVFVRRPFLQSGSCRAGVALLRWRVIGQELKRAGKALVSSNVGKPGSGNPKRSPLPFGPIENDRNSRKPTLISSNSSNKILVDRRMKGHARLQQAALQEAKVRAYLVTVYTRFLNFVECYVWFFVCVHCAKARAQRRAQRKHCGSGLPQRANPKTRKILKTYIKTLKALQTLKILKPLKP